MAARPNYFASTRNKIQYDRKFNGNWIQSIGFGIWYSEGRLDNIPEVPTRVDIYGIPPHGTGLHQYISQVTLETTQPQQEYKKREHIIVREFIANIRAQVESGRDLETILGQMGQMITV